MCVNFVFLFIFPVVVAFNNYCAPLSLLVRVVCQSQKETSANRYQKSFSAKILAPPLVVFALVISFLLQIVLFLLRLFFHSAPCLLFLVCFRAVLQFHPLLQLLVHQKGNADRRRNFGVVDADAPVQARHAFTAPHLFVIVRTYG